MLKAKNSSRLLRTNLSFKHLVYSSFFIFAGCQTTVNNDSAHLAASEGYSAEQTDKLFVVDCLLPGQIRKLGNQMTYLSARRPIKTTAGDCEIKGGEYVAYDRTNYASALKVWLPQAKEGNIEAQVILGEIYEKGLGGLSDPALAAQWYRKAAEKGNSRAQVNLGHLYEKGLGVEKSLSTALNWYRKASGLDQTDLEFASVTEAAVSASYEKKLSTLRQTSEQYKKQSERYRQQLSQARKNYSAQQKSLSTYKNQLDKAQQQLRIEQNKQDADQNLIKKLEQKVQSNQVIYSSQKARLDSIKQTVAKESQASVSSYRQQLDIQQQQLKIKENEYHDAFVDIKSDRKHIEEKSKIATTTQDKLVVEHLRGKLKTAKTSLLTLGREIKALKNSIAENKKIAASLESDVIENITYAQAGIEIIEPTMVLTRGVPSYQLRSISPSKKIIGKISTLKNLDFLTVNGLKTTVGDDGVFQTLIDIKDQFNKVDIIANYNQGDNKKLSFNLLAKDSVIKTTNPTPSTQAQTKKYPSINFGRFYALIIGNQNYSQLPSLQTSIRDAKSVDQVLRNQYGFQTTLLINADRHKVMTALNKLRSKLTKKDNLLIYYAGHGEIDKLDQSAYWLPTDAEVDNSANWLSSHSITQYLNIIAAKHILVVADSCYSGAMTKSAVARLPGKIAEDKRKKWLQFMVKRKARTVLTSGGVKPVLDNGGGKHSVFAKAFLNVLKNNAGLMEDYELFRAVSGQVKKSASLIGFQQTPQYSAMSHTGHEGSPFFFVSNK